VNPHINIKYLIFYFKVNVLMIVLKQIIIIFIIINVLINVQMEQLQIIKMNVLIIMNVLLIFIILLLN
jgi:hypothetical protein